MKVQYYTATSLDGYIADSNNSLDWLFQFGDGSGEGYLDFIEDVGALAMGSTTYEWILANEIYKDPDSAKPWPYKQPSWIFSSRPLPVVDGADTRFVKGDVSVIYGDMVRAASGKNIWIAGGGDLVGQFYDKGLLDELILSIAPVTLGAGAPLLPRQIVAPPLKLISCKPIEGSFIEVRYQVERTDLAQSAHS